MFSDSPVAKSEKAALRSGNTTRNILIFLILIASSFALWWKPLISTLALASSNDAYAYILTIIWSSISSATISCDGL